MQLRSSVNWFIALGFALVLMVGNIRGAEENKAVDDYNFAAWLYNTGKYSMAVDAYEAFLKAFPDHEKQADARFGLAQSRFHIDNFKDAVEAYEQIRKNSPDFQQMAEVLFQLGQSRVALEQFEQAASCFAEITNKYSEHYLADWAVARRAACLLSLGKHADAEALLIPFLDKYTSDKKDAASLPATRKMLQALDSAGIKATGPFLSLIERSSFSLGLTQINQNRFEAASESFKRFLKLYPKSELRTEAQFRLAQSLYRMEEYQAAADAYANVDMESSEFGAVSAFERGLALYKADRKKDAADAFAAMAAQFSADKNAAKAALYAGTFLYETDDYEGAVARLEPLTESDNPFADEAAYWLAMARFRLNQLDTAQKNFEDALKKHPSSAMAGDMRLGLADVLLALNNLKDAAGAFEKYADDSPDGEQAPRALYSAAVALHRADMFDRADEVCKKFLDRYPKDDLAADVLFLSGENRFLADDNEGAAQRYHDFIKQKNGNPERLARAHFRLAWVYHENKRYDEALAQIEKIDTTVADKVIKSESAYVAGLCHFEKGAYADAIKRFEQYIGAEDHSRFGDDAQLKIAIAWEKQEKPENAIQSLRNFMKEYPESELVCHAQFLLAERYSEVEDYREALKHYRVVVDREDAGDLAPYALFGLGVAGYDQKQWNEAADAFGRLVEEYPKSDLVPQAWYRRGRALMNASEWKEASAAFNELLQTAPKHELARAAQVNVATCLQELKEWDSAAKSLSAAIADFKPGDDQPQLYYELAWAHREAGREQDALKAFKELADKFPKDRLAADAFFHLAEARYQTYTDNEGKNEAQNPDDLKKACKLYENAIDAANDDRLLDKALYRIGWCHWLCEEYKAAAAAFDRLAKECPQSDLLPDALFQSGLSYTRLGNRKRALERMDKLLSNSDYKEFTYRPEALIVVADCRLTEGDAQEALKALEQYLSSHSEHYDAARGYLLKGKALYMLKQYGEAMESLEQSTRLTRSSVAAEARFYIGQAHQSQSRYKDAVVAYLRVQALYPTVEEWCAAAMFESAKCYDAMGDSNSATTALRDLIQKYKETKWASLAAERLGK